MALIPDPASASASASASTSASAHSNYRYDVFLNHRGIDVKKTFASHLHRHLLSYGLQVFLDQPELQRGEKIDPQIEGAIATASVHVAIFSPGYAESRWCLDELVSMLTSGATIILYYSLLLCISLTVLINKLLNSYVVLILLPITSDEGELVNQVARQVQKKVRKIPLHVAKHPTGLDETLLDFETTVLLEQLHNRDRPNLVGIVGPGGVGKTTLEKLFFNTKGSDYKRSCFLPNVRDVAARHLLPSWQSKLYKNLTGSDQSIHSIDEGIPMFKHLSGSQALIILDDVDDVK
eukprot:PITA_07588